MAGPPPIFDAQLHLASLTDQDLKDLRYFGVRGAVAVSGDDAPQGDAQALLGDWERQLTVGASRLREAGINPFFSLGIHPTRIPETGFEELIAQLPTFFQRARVVAVGTIGLHEGGEEEEEVVRRQLDVASILEVPVIVSIPKALPAPLAKRSLALVQDHAFPTERVLVSCGDGEAVLLARRFGHHATVLVHPSSFRAEQAARLIRQEGSQGLLLGSDLGRGAGDLVGMARTVHLLGRAGVSRNVARRVARDNALAFFGIDPTIL